MSGGSPVRAHFMQNHVNARLRGLPSGFRPRETATNHVQFRHHGLALAGWGSSANVSIRVVLGRRIDGDLSRNCSTIDAVREEFTFEGPFAFALARRFEAV